MESNEALERKLPTVEGQEGLSNHEQVASTQMEQPSFSAQPQQATSQTPQTSQSGVVLSEQTVASQSTTVQASSTMTAEDVDLIEKAWVQKAKAIIERTHGDPFNQNKELNKVKAQYIKTRYDRDIKIVE